MSNLLNNDTKLIWGNSRFWTPSERNQNKFNKIYGKSIQTEMTNINNIKDEYREKNVFIKKLRSKKQSLEVDEQNILIKIFGEERYVDIKKAYSTRGNAEKAKRITKTITDLMNSSDDIGLSDNDIKLIELLGSSDLYEDIKNFINKKNSIIFHRAAFALGTEEKDTNEIINGLINSNKEKIEEVKAQIFDKVFENKKTRLDIVNKILKTILSEANLLEDANFDNIKIKKEELGRKRSQSSIKKLLKDKILLQYKNINKDKIGKINLEIKGEEKEEAITVFTLTYDSEADTNKKVRLYHLIYKFLSNEKDILKLFGGYCGNGNKKGTINGLKQLLSIEVKQNIDNLSLIAGALGEARELIRFHNKNVKSTGGLLQTYNDRGSFKLSKKGKIQEGYKSSGESFSDAYFLLGQNSEKIGLNIKKYFSSSKIAIAGVQKEGIKITVNSIYRFLEADDVDKLRFLWANYNFLEQNVGFSKKSISSITQAVGNKNILNIIRLTGQVNEDGDLPTTNYFFVLNGYYIPASCIIQELIEQLEDKNRKGIFQVITPQEYPNMPQSSEIGEYRKKKKGPLPITNILQEDTIKYKINGFDINLNKFIK